MKLDLVVKEGEERIAVALLDRAKDVQYHLGVAGHGISDLTRVPAEHIRVDILKPLRTPSARPDGRRLLWPRTPPSAIMSAWQKGRWSTSSDAAASPTRAVRGGQAHESLSRADLARPLAAEDLELLATSAYMLGQDDEYVSGLERAHHAYLHRAEALRAARCAFWIGMNLVLRGETGPASGWLARARRLVEREGRDCVESGYLLLPTMFELKAAGDRDAAIAAAAEAAAMGERFGDADLFALAAHDQGILLIEHGRVAEGLGLLDEAMVAVTAGELSPIVNGFVYCGVITGCQAAYDPRRAQEWTAALTRWCEAQPDMVSFSGTCLVHRAEIMQLHGAWSSALEEARRAGERCAQASNRAGVAQALYRQGELHRLRGEFAAADEAYRSASRRGWSRSLAWR